MTAKAGVISAGPLDRIEYTAHCVHGSPHHEPKEANGGQGDADGADGEDGQPAHEQVDRAGEPAGDGELGDGQYHTHHPHTPHQSQQDGATAVPKGGQAQRSIAASDKKVDGAVVIFPQSETAGHRYPQAVVQSAGCVEADHRQPIDSH